jgi:LytS/YehU family sensor histidine kinase
MSNDSRGLQYLKISFIFIWNWSFFLRLYESEGATGYLEKDIENIGNYIEIERMRQIEFDNIHVPIERNYKSAVEDFLQYNRGESNSE